MIEKEQLISMVLGLQNGEEKAATQLYETFRDDIYYFIFKTVNNDRELAEDLTQDTFVEIFTTIDKLQEPAAFVTWSKQIAYHKCTAYFRKRKELLVDENEDGYSVFDTIEEDHIEFIPDAALDQEDLKQTILKMINDLPEDQKSAIILRYFNEISVKEIAEIQGVTEGTVKSRLNYGRKAIKQSVEAFEKKHDIKLHCTGVLPLLLWLFKEYRIGSDLSVSAGTATQAFVITENAASAAGIVSSSASASVGTSVAASTTTTATAASATTAAAASTAATTTAAKVAVGIGAKILGSTLATKIVAGVAAVTIAVVGVSVGLSVTDKPKDTEPVHIEAQVVATEATIPYTTEVPTTAAPEETTVPPTGETTITTEVETSSPTEAECAHEWSYYSTSYDLDDIPEYEDRTCLKCGAFEILYQTSEPACSHPEFIYYTEVGYDTIHEQAVCNVCGWFEQTAYVNNCPHNIIQYTEQINTTLYTYETCTLCGYNQLISTEEVSCEHAWVYSSFERDGQLHEVRDCNLCNTREVISVTDIVTGAEPTHYHEWEVVEIIDVNYPYDVDVRIVCRDCGAETISDYYEIEEVPTEGTEGAQDYATCATCGAICGNINSPYVQCEVCRGEVCDWCGGPMSDNHNCDDYPNVFCPNPDCGWSMFTTGTSVFGIFCPLCGEQCA